MLALMEHPAITTVAAEGACVIDIADGFTYIPVQGAQR